MRPITKILDMIPYGPYWNYLRTFVRVFFNMVSFTLFIVLSFVLLAVPFVYAVCNESCVTLLWYFFTVPAWAPSVDFISRYFEWNRYWF